MKIYLGIPSYNQMLEAKAVEAIWFAGGQGVAQYKCESVSLLAYGFNRLWCNALNARKNGITHFLLLHSDVIPYDAKNWVNILKAEMLEKEADVMSVVVPIKSPQGLTSTAYDMSCEENPWAVQRLTMSQVMALPETFTHLGLLINTGCLLVDITKPWAEKICFTVNDKIVRLEDGSFMAQNEPEDWNFSRQVSQYGGSIWATRKVVVAHMGRADYMNDDAWGSETTDPLWKGIQ